MRLVRALYRDLLADAKVLDSHASLRALVTTHLRESALSPVAKKRLPHVEAFNRSLVSYLGGRHMYLPDARRPELSQLVREAFHDAQTLASDADGIDTAFVALRALNQILADAKALELPPSNAPEPRKPYDVQLTENVVPGVFLLAHPLLDGIFSRSVVILTSHKIDGSTTGYIVNKVSKKTLGRMFQVPSRVTRAFATSSVHMGGPVVTRDAEVIHGRAEFGGQRVPTPSFPTTDDPSLFVGVDLDAAARAIYDETAEPTEIVFMSGKSTWSPGQLKSELKQGSWIAVQAPVSLALNARTELWQDLMESLGGEYAEMSCMPCMDDDE